MKTFNLVIIYLASSSLCIADGWADLSGKNRKGENISIDRSYETDPKSTFSIKENRYDIYVREKGKVKSKIYPEQECVFKPNQFEPIEFSCEASGKSPLSGVSYKIVRNKDPDDCSFEFMFICTRGCGSPAVPQRMYWGYWECGM